MDELRPPPPPPLPPPPTEPSREPSPSTIEPVAPKRGFFARAKQRREERRVELEAADARKATARARYLELLERLGAGEGAALVPALKEAAASAEFETTELQTLTASTFRRHAEQVLEDDLLTEDEEQRLLDVANTLGIEELQTNYRDILNRLVVARVNDGRLLAIPSPMVMTKPGEEVYLETEADLMKEVAIREYQGGYSGVSFRVMKGVRFSTGGIRGKSVVVGTQLQVADSGVLSVTSQRVVFMGAKTTTEMAYKKLINLTVFTDGVRVHVSNRKTAPLFRVESGSVVAAVVNAAFQRLS